MTHSNDDDFTRNLNDRIRELENMTNEINDQTQELEDQASKNEQAGNDTAESETMEINQAEDHRAEGDTIFFTANVDSTKPLKLNVTNNNGDLEVVGTDINHVEIMATRDEGEDVDHTHWFFQQVENEITLRPNWQVGSHVSDLTSKIKNQLKEGFKSSEWSSKDFKFGMDVSYDIVVRIPKNLAADSTMKLKTANGDGQIDNVAGKIDFKTANGDVTANGVDGDLTINSANGDLIGKGVTGSANASTANGDIHLEGVTGQVEANTANGDIGVDGGTGFMAIRTANGDANVENVTLKGGRFATVAGDMIVSGVFNNDANYSFDTVTGDVRVKAEVPSGGAKLNGKSLSGEIAATGDWESQSKREWIIGEGDGPKISVKSVSSDIHVHATVSEDVELLHEDPAASAEKDWDDNDRSESGGSSDINVNLDFEIERAKGWIKDIGSKLGAFLNDGDGSGPKSPANVKVPETPQTPEPPKAPESPEAKSETADRRTRLLEAVKNGEMTVDEALAELERES